MTRTRAPSRKPGRPLTDAADLRERLVDVALAQFAAQGIAAATLRGIAKDSGVTPALVTYYFGSKERLVTTVIEERVMPAFAGAMAGLAQVAPDTLVPAFVDAANRMVEKHPWMPGLWVREILTEGGALREMMLEHVAPVLPRMLAERFAAQQRAGTLNPDLDPRLLVVSLIGLTLFAHASRPVWSRIFDAADITSAQLTHHTLSLLQRGLEATP